MGLFRGIGGRPKIHGDLAACAVVLSLAATPAEAAAQDPTFAPAGSIGLALVDLQPGVSFSGGTRMYWGRFITTGVLDLTLVGAGGDRYELRLDGLSLECRDVIAGTDVRRSWCEEPELRIGGVVDVAVAFTEDATGLRPLVGAGYRLGDAATAFGAVGVTGRFASGAPWYARILAGRRFIQLHFGFAGR